MPKILGYEPAVILYVLNAALAAGVSYGLPLNHAVVAATVTIATALLSAYAALLTRPIVVSALTSAAGTILAAIAAYGLHFSADQIGSTVTLLSLLLALLLRQNVSPAPALATRR